jgi:hypothetical protein
MADQWSHVAHPAADRVLYDRGHPLDHVWWGWMLIGVIDLFLAVAATIALPLMSKARRR